MCAGKPISRWATAAGQQRNFRSLLTIVEWWRTFPGAPWPAPAPTTMQGDTTKAKAAYQDFLTLWKDADPDIPILKQAKAEYAKLQ